MTVHLFSVFSSGITAAAFTEACAIVMLVSSAAAVWLCRPPMDLDRSLCL
jgi:hypothetical protein